MRCVDVPARFFSAIQLHLYSVEQLSLDDRRVAALDVAPRSLPLSILDILDRSPRKENDLRIVYTNFDVIKRFDHNLVCKSLDVSYVIGHMD